jgi:hypothetical protein
MAMTDDGPLRSDNATLIGCPDCSGVLRELVENESDDHARNECRIRHAYWLPGVAAAKEAEVEQRWWSLVPALDTLARVYQRVPVHLQRTGGANPSIALIAARRAQVEAHGRTLRRQPEDGVPPPLGRLVEPTGEPR